MEHYVGLDVSPRLTAICIVDRTGKIEREGVVRSDPEAIAAFTHPRSPTRHSESTRRRVLERLTLVTLCDIRSSIPPPK
jgi:hypothetical protein